MADTPVHHRLDATPDDLYASPPPWDIGRPQPAFLAGGWRTDSIEPATIDVTIDPGGIRA